MQYMTCTAQLDQTWSCRHYIPVSTSISPDPKNEHMNLVDMVKWAENNPAHVAAIVDEAREFANNQLSELAQTCYTARLLLAYSALLKQDAEQPVNMTLLPSSPSLADPWHKGFWDKVWNRQKSSNKLHRRISSRQA